MIHAGPCPTEQACIRIARSKNELAQALSLVYHCYLEAGLVQRNPAHVRVLPQHALPTTEVIVGKVRNEVFATSSLVHDGRLGLPLESVFASEVADRRTQCLRLAEISCLADRRRSTSRRSLLELMVFTIQCAKARGVDQLLIAVHPRHVNFYLKYFGFRVFGGLRHYDAVRGNPAIGLCLDLNELKARSPKAHQRIFGRGQSKEHLARQPLSMGAERYVAQMLTACRSYDADFYQSAALAS